MTDRKKIQRSEVRVYSNGKLAREQIISGGPAPGYVGKRKASIAAKAARRKAS